MDTCLHRVVAFGEIGKIGEAIEKNQQELFLERLNNYVENNMQVKLCWRATKGFSICSKCIKDQMHLKKIKFVSKASKIIGDRPIGFGNMI